MSVDLQRLCWRIEFPSAAMSSVAVKLADCANDDGENVYPSVGRIERETRLGASTVRRCLAAFEEAGLLDVIEEASGNRWLRSTVIRRWNVALLHALSAVEVRHRGADGRQSIELCRSTHVLVERPDGNRKRWAVVERTDDIASDYPPLPQREGHPEPKPAPAPPAVGGATNDRPSQSGSPPLPEREGTPPTAGAKPSIEPSKEDSPPSAPGAEPRGSKRAGSEIWEGLDKARALGIDQSLLVDHLLGPVLAVRKLDAEDKPLAIVALAGRAAGRGLGEAALAEACGQLLETRRATVKPSDVEAAIDNAERIERRLAEAYRRRAALPRRVVLPVATVDFRTALRRMAPADHLAAWWPCLDDAGIAAIDDFGPGRRRVTLVAPERAALLEMHAASWATAAVRAAVGPDAEVEFVQGVGVFDAPPALGGRRPAS